MDPRVWVCRGRLQSGSSATGAKTLKGPKTGRAENAKGRVLSEIGWLYVWRHAGLDRRHVGLGWRRGRLGIGGIMATVNAIRAKKTDRLATKVEK
jgi:hypothetical protein